MNKDIEMIKRWTRVGDTAMKSKKYDLAISLFRNAFSIATIEKAKYLLPRISACYRKMNQPRAAIYFYRKAFKKFGEAVFDTVALTAISSAFGDTNNWESALKYANTATYLNDGVVDEYLENVYGRIHYNMQFR